LPGFLRVWSILVQDTAAASARPTVAPASSTLVVPLAVRATDVAAALAAHTAYDLFAHPLTGGYPPSLNLGVSGAPTFGTTAENMRSWSDGQHLGTWQLSQPSTLTLADATYYDAIASGLLDNVRRQSPTDSSSSASALVSLPVYDTSTSTTVHVVGFAQMRLKRGDISAGSARGVFVLYPTAAWATPTTPAPDLGASVVALVP
jgi:hypothetical protein